MTLEEMNLEENLEMELEDKLSCLTADLVEFESNSLFLERLFSEEVGKWIEIESLCSGLQEIESQLEELKELFVACCPEGAGTLRVTSLDYPDAACGEGFCLIIFFVEALHWSNLALYNKQLFLRKLSRQTSLSA
ncbi:hypothetical protein H6F98_15850 [Microcoleus sp. FACHB-SPT15]|uniref:hypothetical protein n=1 Tax=Microcoleus sp. FACHB-SPT15 TaxID=2692830 RepID=UPI001783131C|nr:hypothetical protein [Microcoleus sp. FACHB-SPT15]MBD1806921.1 hypothetical protein [Microcoleus sp. FACHB-SPT15]